MKKRFLGVYDYTVILTYISLLSGVLGIIFATWGSAYHHAAVFCVLFSGLCDAFDGAVARTKKNRTDDERNFGIQLDSLCDVISFGIVPALVCYFMGVDGVIGIAIVFFYVLCALIRLAFFNVIEAKRQKVESGSSKYYRGLPVTTICMILPPTDLLNFVLPKNVFEIVLHVMLVVVGFLFIFDFKVRKTRFDKIFSRKGKKKAKNIKKDEINV